MDNGDREVTGQWATGQKDKIAVGQMREGSGVVQWVLERWSVGQWDSDAI